MAGGEFAAEATCARCAGRAVRTYEGSEDDHYCCTSCGYNFGIDWSRSGPASKPLWPPSDIERQMILSVAAVVSSASKTTEDKQVTSSVEPAPRPFAAILGAKLRRQPQIVDVPTLWRKFRRQSYFPWLLVGLAFTMGRCSVAWW
jgi:hypothetical protein